MVWKPVWQFLKKFNTELPYDLVIPLVGIYPQEQKVGVQTKTCIGLFIAALVTIAKRRNDPNVQQMNG